MKNIIRNSIALIIIFSTSLVMAQTFTNYSTTNGLPDNNVLGVAIDGNHVKWFATQGGLAKYDDFNWTVYTTANGMIDNFVNCVAVDLNNNIWIGTDLGASKFDGNTFTNYTTANGLANNTIADIAVDIDGSIWFGTSNGLSHLSGTTWTSYTTANGLANNLISCITIDNSGTKWIGTWIGGLSKYNGSTFTTYTTAQGLLDNNITAIGVDVEGYVWIGTYYGVTALNSSGAWVVNFVQADGLYNNYIQDIVFDMNNTKWFGIYADYIWDGAITRYTGTTWTSFSTPEGLCDKLVNQLAVDQGNIIWVATGNGVSRLDNATGIGAAEAANELSVFPNPASGFVIIPQHKETVEIEILDITGQLMFTTIVPAGSDRIDISMLSAGIYILRLTENTTQYTTKLITL